jgi:hypothetical protein
MCMYVKERDEWQVLHSCCQFMPWGIWLSPSNERNPWVDRTDVRSTWSWSVSREANGSRQSRGRWMKSSPYSLYGMGYRCVTMDIDRGWRWCESEWRPDKGVHSTDYRVKLVYMKEEPVVIKYQNDLVKEHLSIGLTARQRLRDPCCLSDEYG